MRDRRDDPVPLPDAKPRLRQALERATRPALLALAALGSVALCALLLTRASAPSASVTEADVGNVAKSEVRASQDLYVPDAATTERLRDEAARAAPLVYVHDASVFDRRAALVRRAFGYLRAEFDAFDEALRRAEDQGEPAARAEWLARVRLRAALRQRKADFLHLLPVGPHEFDGLVRLRFSKKAEDAVVRLLQGALDARVVKDKVRFLIDASARVLLREEGGSALVPIEKALSPQAVVDEQGARVKIAEIAAEVAPDVPIALREVLVGVARRLVAENLTLDRETTEANRRRARETVPAQFRYFPRGTTLLRQGDVITPEHVRIVKSMTPEATGPDAARAFFGNALLTALVGGLAFAATRIRSVRRRLSGRDHFLILLILVFSLFLVRSAVEVSDILHERWREVPLSSFLLAIPVAFGVMLSRLFFLAELAFLFSFVMALFVGVLTGGNLYFAAYVAVAGFAAALVASRPRQRTHLLRAGTLVGLVQAGAAVCLTLASGQGAFPSTEASGVPAQGLFSVWFLLDLAASMVSGALSGLLVAALVPVVEATLGYTTDMKYLELANLENPLLKELFLAAPGTYHHSVVAGTLAEAAAEAIGANSSLARVGAYYHDVGKGKCPHYFAENQRGENPHEKLAPHMSALILRSHVRDGVDILREHKIPKPIVDICEQHLGTTKMEFFFDKAVALARENDQPPPEETDFRYPGPKPQFREAALVFIADSVEAAARAIDDPTEPRLSDMVRRIIRNKFIDGQLDECDLTLRDLNAIARAMTRVLVAIYHTRPKYPSQLEAEKAASEDRAQAPIDLAERRRRERK